MSSSQVRPTATHPATRQGILRPSIRAIRIVLGLTWILAGALQFQPFMFSPGFPNEIIAPLAQGQPGWVGAPIAWSVHVISHHLVYSNAAAATLQILIGFGLLFRRSVKVALVVSFVWTLGVWWFGEGLGMVAMGMALPLTGAPGAVLLYGLVGALVWPEKPNAGGSSTENRIERAARWTVPFGRMAWAALWFLAAVLWLLPANRGASSFHNDVQAASYGWLGPVQHVIANVSNGDGLGIAIGLATVSTVIGLGVFFPPTVRPALALGAFLSVAYWAFGQDFGLITTGKATDVNAGPLFVLLALRLWADSDVVSWRSAEPRRDPSSVGGRPVGIGEARLNPVPVT